MPVCAPSNYFERQSHCTHLANFCFNIKSYLLYKWTTTSPITIGVIYHMQLFIYCLHVLSYHIVSSLLSLYIVICMLYIIPVLLKCTLAHVVHPRKLWPCELNNHFFNRLKQLKRCQLSKSLS